MLESIAAQKVCTLIHYTVPLHVLQDDKIRKAEDTSKDFKTKLENLETAIGKN